MAGCGKKGPPLPPLVRIPAPPAEFVAERRGDRVDLQFTVPAANTDNSRPANIERVDVYGLTGAAAMTDNDVLKYGARVGSVDVKAPRDPDAAADPDEGDTEADAEPPEGTGIDQGARAHVEETISAAALAPRPTVRGDRKRQVSGEGPLVGPPVGAPLTRTYLSVGISTRGRKGAVSKRVIVPLVPPPPAPAPPEVNVTESAVDVAWSAPTAAAERDVLPSRAIGEAAPSFGYNVYEVAAPGGDEPEMRLTKAPLTTTTFTDPRITWGEQRCYAITAVETFGATIVESEPSRPKCVKLVDTFPPAPPKGLTAVASQGQISLIWEPNTEPDLAGYIVLRGAAPGETLTPLTAAPIADTTFKDNVQPGVRLVYAVQAVDKAGNVSAISAKIEETAR